MINTSLNINTSYKQGTSNNVKLPSITFADLKELQKQSILFPQYKEKAKKEKSLLNKYITKAAIVISTIISANHISPKLLKHSKSLLGELKFGSMEFGLPIAIGVAVGGLISSACQLLLNKEVKKDYLISDLKDALISSSILGGFGILITHSTKFLSLFSLDNHSLVKRLCVNGLSGGIYAGLRGIIKPEKEDKFTMKNLALGFTEGVFLGEGARLLFKVPTTKLLGNLPKIFKTTADYLKLFTGAAVGSFAFKSAYYAVSHKEDLKNHKKPKDILDDFFKGNSYPTIII